MYKFSKTTNAFYPLSLIDSYTDLPDDLVDVKEDVFNEFSGQAPVGKMRGADKKGMPAWVDLPEPEPLTLAELETQARRVRDSFLTVTDRMMLQDYTMGDYRLEEWQREELISTRDAFKRWPKSETFPDLAKLPTIPNWLYFETKFLGWNDLT